MTSLGVWCIKPYADIENTSKQELEFTGRGRLDVHKVRFEGLTRFILARCCIAMQRKAILSLPKLLNGCLKTECEFLSERGRVHFFVQGVRLGGATFCAFV